MYFGGSVVSEPNLVSFKTSLNFESPAFENAARYPNSETKLQYCDDRRMSWISLQKLCTRNPDKALSVLSDPPPKIARENALYRRQLSRGLLDFAQILYRV